MASRRPWCFVVVAAAAAGLALPAPASATGFWSDSTGAGAVADAAPPAAAPDETLLVPHRGRAARCGGTVALSLALGARILQRRTVHVDRRCRFEVTFRVRRSALAGATRLRVTRRGAAAAIVRVVSERLGSRGLDPGTGRSPLALE